LIFDLFWRHQVNGPRLALLIVLGRSGNTHSEATEQQTRHLVVKVNMIRLQTFIMSRFNTWNLS
jgi:hypothetical protein